MLFRKKPKPPLEMAFQFLANAILIVYGYQHNKRYMPSEHDLKMIDLLEREMQLDCATVGYVARCLHQRAAGQPEGSLKFTRPDSFDYHYSE